MRQCIIESNADLVPFFDTLQGIFWRGFWDSPPYALLAHEAFNLEHLSDNDARSVWAAVQVNGWRQDGLQGVIYNSLKHASLSVDYGACFSKGVL